MMLFELAIIVVNEQPNPHLVPPDVLAERERLTYEIGTALAQGVVEALDVCVSPVSLPTGRWRFDGSTLRYAAQQSV
jgi:hypothetical protein